MIDIKRKEEYRKMLEVAWQSLEGSSENIDENRHQIYWPNLKGHPLLELAGDIHVRYQLPKGQALVVVLGMASCLAFQHKRIQWFETKDYLPIGLFVLASEESGAGKSPAMNAIYRDSKPMIQEERYKIERKISFIENNLGKEVDSDTLSEAMSNIEKLRRQILYLPSTAGTPEGLKKHLSKRGFVPFASGEITSFSSITGLDSSGKMQSSTLNLAYDGEVQEDLFSTIERTRKPGSAAIVCFAQPRLIDMALSHNDNSGLMGRILCVREPSMIGRRTHGHYSNTPIAGSDRIKNVISEMLKERDNMDLGYENLSAYQETEKDYACMMDWKNTHEHKLNKAGVFGSDHARQKFGKIHQNTLKVAGILQFYHPNDKIRNSEYLDHQIYQESLRFVESELIHNVRGFNKVNEARELFERVYKAVLPWPSKSSQEDEKRSLNNNLFTKLLVNVNRSKIKQELSEFDIESVLDILIIKEYVCVFDELGQKPKYFKNPLKSELPFQ